MHVAGETLPLSLIVRRCLPDRQWTFVPNNTRDVLIDKSTIFVPLEPETWSFILFCKTQKHTAKAEIEQRTDVGYLKGRMILRCVKKQFLTNVLMIAIVVPLSKIYSCNDNYWCKPEKNIVQI